MAILVSSDATVLMHAAAAHCLRLYHDAVDARGVFHMALSGGSTPKSLFQLLATSDYAAQFDWSLVHLWWSDERFVPLDHPDSNYRMAYEVMISKVPIPASNVHATPVNRLHLVSVNPGDGDQFTLLEAARTDAAQYEADILASIGAPPVFDLILLGIGDDGHTASLFPGTLGDVPADRLVIAHFVPKVNMQRITFTPKLINAAYHVAFLVSGKGKTSVLDRVVRGPHLPDVLPSQLVAPVNGEVTWLIDRDAAGANF